MSHFIRVKLCGSGRVHLPSELRRELGFQEGENLLMSSTEYGIQISTMNQAVRQSQAMVRQYLPSGTSLVNELRTTRRQDATLA